MENKRNIRNAKAFLEFPSLVPDERKLSFAGSLGNIKVFILKCLFVLAAFWLALNLPLKAYNNTMVHPALTEEAVKFYNLNFSSNKIGEQEMNWIKQGSVEEDAGIRPLNHFYDPVHNIGLKGVELSAKNWSQNTLA